MQAGALTWVYFGDPVGREQGGRRPALVVSSDEHLDATSLVTVVPCTTRDRGWAHHVRLDSLGIKTPTFAMTEQIRTVSRERVGKQLGVISPECLASAMEWVSRWLALPR